MLNFRWFLAIVLAAIFGAVFALADTKLPFPASPQQKTVLLRRYVDITPYAGWSKAVDRDGGKTYPYMDVGDTYLARANPDLNFGRSEKLIIEDPEHDRILIQFGRLYRWITTGCEVDKVELLLIPAGKVDPNTTIALHRMTASWRDGGGRGIKMVQTATYNERYSKGAHLDKYARPWTTPGGEDDCIDQPSFVGKLGDYWDDGAGAYVLSSDRMAKDVEYWLGRYYRNHGWLIHVAPGSKPEGTIAFHASDTFEERLRPALRVTFTEKPIVRPDLPDLDVTYIERTPRYYRYHDNGHDSYLRQPFRGDMPGIMLNPEFAEDQKWPEPGERVTFIAHIKNASDTPYKGPLSYRWLINDEVVRERRSTPTRTPEGYTINPLTIEIGPWEEITTFLYWHWDVDLKDPRKVVLAFEVDPDEEIREITENNNVLNKYVAGKTWKYWVERGLYEHVKNHPKPWGSYSFEDYLQWHADVWNETYFDKSRFDDFAPDGCVLRMTIDEIEIMADGQADSGVHRAEGRPDVRFDGEWGSRWIRPDADDAQRENYFGFVESRQIILEPSLLHEGSHQVWGAYDIYWSVIEAAMPDKPHGRNHLKNPDGTYVTHGDWWQFAGLMGGGDTRPNPNYRRGTGLYSANSVGGGNAEAPYRAGFFGPWQYDMPRKCYLQLNAQDGTPLEFPKITLWQQTWKGMLPENQVAADVPGSSTGLVQLPNQDSLEARDVTTADGHTLYKWNPWGRLDVVGQNITFCVRIEAYGQQDYKFVRVTDFNRACWNGHTESFALPLECRISPSHHIDFDINVAEGAHTTASRDSAHATHITDGDITTDWNGGPSEPGDYIEIVLPKARKIGMIHLVQDRHHGGFFDYFVIKTRPSESSANETIFAKQDPYRFKMAMDLQREVNPDRTSERWVKYAHAPVMTKVIRIEATGRGHAHLTELRAFAESP